MSCFSTVTHVLSSSQARVLPNTNCMVTDKTVQLLSPSQAVEALSPDRLLQAALAVSRGWQLLQREA